ncbi:agmatinase [Sinanaerobacter sp. ZZT-01]|uniref:agmatinase n=1 Tax=Sinanaerobacter sp. ZZT-01 TaxID=3111540 RepID=UPI002D799459|nr:agmatinase [Sinanaerobacter sp. ZZT-01]WRR94838.1 agmatinase [Sinanaerobacter sp. ZZT-01]
MLTKDELTKTNKIWCGMNKPDITEDEADVVIFGIPYDEAVSYRKGAAETPSVLRANTLHSTEVTEDGERLDILNIHDAGDFLEKDREQLFKQVEEYVCELVKKEKFFTMIGGDHSVTIPVEAGIDKAVDEPFGIIHVDSHPDMCDELGGDKYSHGAVQRRALELKNVVDSESISFVGIRSLEIDEINYFAENKCNVHNAKECYKKGIEKVAEEVIEEMKRFKKVYLTVDIDSLDPAYAAGTGTLQIGGLSSREMLIFLEKIFEKLPIIAMDVVEVAPPLDSTLNAMFAARRIITECWGFNMKKNKKK